MAGGAVVAAAAAAHAKRIQDIVDAFRLAGATSPERARSLAELFIVSDAALQELTRAAVLLPGQRAGTWYLSEPAFISRREARERTSSRAVLIVAIVGLHILLAGAVIAAVLTRGNS